MTSSPPPHVVFPATDRFDVEGVLGRGAFGIVYALRDRRQGTALAAKMLYREHPGALARFKQEFRALADLHHPNLVRLYELHADGERWFFTMERLRGQDPLTYLAVRGPTAATLTESVSNEAIDDAVSPEQPSTDPTDNPAAASAPDPDGLRSVFGQIARGLAALHDAGLVHRDLKPSNVLVDADGHAKLLDFGLAQPVARSNSRAVAGTLAYMAPELLAGGAASPASDWFAMGVTLHQALTAALPRRTPQGLVLGAPAAPHGSLPGSPLASLWDLCVSLLEAEPSKRPTGASVLEALGAASGPAPVWSADATDGLIGRATELERLLMLLERSRSEGAQLAFIFGASGVGKSALSQAFGSAAVDRGALVLSGRCFQQENAPLKALDGIVDALALSMQEDTSLSATVLPVIDERSGALCSVFPVLRAVPALADRSTLPCPQDPHEIRHQAFDGLADIVAALSRWRPVVLFVDDLQWADADSADAIARVLRATESAGAMFVATCRTEEREASAFLARWEQHDGGCDLDAASATFELGPLSRPHARRLARRRLAKDAGVDPDRIARESGGNPFLVEELARQAHRVRSGSADLWMGLAEALHARIGSLPPDARTILELVIVAGRPIDEDTLQRASGLGAGTFGALDTARAAHLLRLRQRGAVRVAEPYHDRIRETLLQVFDDDAQRTAHQRLAIAILSSPHPDHERIARHLHAAGDVDGAAKHALHAATSAEDNLAFERAADQLAFALDHLPSDDARRESLQRRHADALIHCGRGARAAPILKSLALDSRTQDDLRRAAEQWMITGHVDRGIATLQDVLRRDGLRWPERPGGIMAAVFRDLSFVALQRGRAKPPPYDPRRLSAVDTCWTGVRGLSSVDHLRGLYFAVHGMRLAQSVGEPRRVAKLGMFFAAQLRAMGLPGGVGLFDRYSAQALDSTDPELHAYVDYLEGYVQLQRGEAAAAGAALDAAIERFEAECTGVGWEVSVALSMLCETLAERGAMHRLAKVSADALRRAESLSDIQAAHGAHLFVGLSALAQGQPARARRHYAEIPEVGVVDGFHYTHFVSALGQSLVDLYQAKEAHAWDRIEAMQPKLERSGLMRSPFVKSKLLARKGTCTVALMAASEQELKPRRREALRCAAALKKLDRRDANAEAAQLRAACAALDGESERAGELLEIAAKQFDALGLDVRRALCRLRAAELRGEHDADAVLAIEAAGIDDVGRWAAAFAPGFRRSPSS